MTATDAPATHATAAFSLGEPQELGFILDIPLEISVELGRSRLLISELLNLEQGSVIELDKMLGEPLNVYANGRLIAKGEAVVIKKKLSIRLLEIIHPTPPHTS